MRYRLFLNCLNPEWDNNLLKRNSKLKVSLTIFSERSRLGHLVTDINPFVFTLSFVWKGVAWVRHVFFKNKEFFNHNRLLKDNDGFDKSLYTYRFL